MMTLLFQYLSALAIGAQDYRMIEIRLDNSNDNSLEIIYDIR